MRCYFFENIVLYVSFVSASPISTPADTDVLNTRTGNFIYWHPSALPRCACAWVYLEVNITRGLKMQVVSKCTVVSGDIGSGYKSDRKEKSVRNLFLSWWHVVGSNFVLFFFTLTSHKKNVLCKLLCAVFKCQFIFTWSNTLNLGHSQNGDMADGSKTSIPGLQWDCTLSSWCNWDGF